VRERWGMDKRWPGGGYDAREMDANLQIKVLVPRRRKRSLDDLSGLARVVVPVDGDDGKWVWESEDLSLDEPVGCNDCLGVIWMRWEGPREDLRWKKRKEQTVRAVAHQ